MFYRLLCIGGFAWVSGFCVTYWSGLAMVYQAWYIKRYPQKFMPKDPTKRQEATKEEERKEEVKKHAEGHLRLMQEKARLMKAGIDPRRTPLPKSAPLLCRQVLVKNLFRQRFTN